MDYTDTEIQQALAECRRVMADQIIYERDLQEENRQLKEFLLMRQNPAAVMEYLQDHDTNAWKAECRSMQNSLSWRITKPLRLMKKVMQSVHTVGWKYTLKKILQKL